MPRDRFPTVFVTVERLTGLRTLASVSQAAATLAAWALVYATWRRTRAFLPRLVAIAVAMPLATPFMLEYDLTLWAAPGLAITVALWRGEANLVDRATLVLWLATPPVIWIASVAWGIGIGLVPVLLLLVRHLVDLARTPSPSPAAA